MKVAFGIVMLNFFLSQCQKCNISIALFMASVFLSSAPPAHLKEMRIEFLVEGFGG